MLYIFTFLFVSITANAAIKCSSAEILSSKSKLFSATSLSNAESAKVTLIQDLLNKVCVRSEYTALPKVQRAPAGTGLSNLFYMMALPIGVHTTSDN